MSETSPSTLGEFETAGQPTSVDELEALATDAVVEAFENIERWRVVVRLNGRDEQLLVGRSPERDRNSFRLYRTAGSGNEFAGVLARDRTYGRKPEQRIGFTPAGDGPSDETVVEPVTDLQVVAHEQTDELDEVLPALRTALTESDWIDGRGDAGYGEWIQAVNELANFVSENYDENTFCLPPRAVMQARVMHAIARYPLSAENLLSQAADSFEDNMDGGVYDASPEALRTVLLTYAEQEMGNSRSAAEE